MFFSLQLPCVVGALITVKYCREWYSGKSIEFGLYPHSTIVPYGLKNQHHNSYLIIFLERINEVLYVKALVNIHANLFSENVFITKTRKIKSNTVLK